MRRSIGLSVKRFARASALVAAALLVTPAIAGNGKQNNGNNGDNGQAQARYLIQYQAGNGQALRDAIAMNGGTVALDYSSLFDGLAADLSADGIKAIRSSGLAKKIEDDGVRTLHKQEAAAFEDGGIEAPSPDALPPGFPNGVFSEFVPYGRDRVNADVVWSVGPNFGTADNGVATPDVAGGSITGAGVVVAVLDSGIDYDHPDLVANIINDCGSGVIRDFLPSNFQGAGNAGNDDCSEDDTFNGHGTSVASVIASVDNTVGLIGVAPGASIRPYRVCDGQCPISAIIGGLMQATADGVDVINMSFGGGAGMNIEAAAIQAANREGVVLVASAGNGASQVVQFPAGYDTVLAVGATDINDNPAGFTNVGGWVDVTGPGVNNPTATCTGCVVTATLDETSPTAQSFSPNAMTGSPIGAAAGAIKVSADIVDVGRGCLATAGDTHTTNPSGKIALIIRGACSFAEKVFFAEAAGAVGTVIYNQNPGNFFGTLGAFSAAGPSASISNAEGVTLATEIAGGTTTADLDVFRDTPEYWFISGTSFSSPHTAGVAALVLEADPSLSPIEVRKIIEMTAEDLGSQFIFGEGMIRADNAVNAATP